METFPTATSNLEPGSISSTIPGADFESMLIWLPDTAQPQAFTSYYELGHAFLTVGDAEYTFEDTPYGSVYLITGGNFPVKRIPPTLEAAFTTRVAAVEAFGRYAYDRFPRGSRQALVNAMADPTNSPAQAAYFTRWLALLDDVTRS